MPRPLTPSFIKHVDTPTARTIGLALYYAGILLAVLAMYSLGEVAPTTFIYQGF
jgi:hypothetical protein